MNELMKDSNQQFDQSFERRKRLHDLLIALIRKQNDLELMDVDSTISHENGINAEVQDPASWLNRNQRLLRRYQALVRTAVTLDALLDAENLANG